MTCWKCSAQLQGAKKFCTECGAPAQAPASAIDPFASTVQPTSRAAPSVQPSAPSQRGPVSPLALSAFEFNESAREIVPREAEAPPAPGSEKLGATVLMQQVPSKPAPAPVAKPASVLPPSFGTTPAPNAPIGPGMAVRVRWANGQKYPGTVWQVQGTQVLVAFPDGQRHWVEIGFVERS